MSGILIYAFVIALAVLGFINIRLTLALREQDEKINLKEMLYQDLLTDWLGLDREHKRLKADYLKQNVLARQIMESQRDELDVVHKHLEESLDGSLDESPVEESELTKVSGGALTKIEKEKDRYAVEDKIALLDTSHAREEVEKDKFVASARLKELLEEGYEVHIVSSRPQFLPETADKCLFDLLPERNFWCCDQGLSFEGGPSSPAQVDVWLRAIGGIDYDGYDGCNIVDLRVDLRLRPEGSHRKGQVEIQEEARRHGIVVNKR